MVAQFVHSVVLYASIGAVGAVLKISYQSNPGEDIWARILSMHADTSSHVHNLRSNIGVCEGFNGDDTVRIEVSPDNTRTLIDSARPQFVQSVIKCVGNAPELLHGKCDDDTIRAAWKCNQADFSKDQEFSPYFKAVVNPILDRCHADPSAPPSVLMLGLGGGSKPSYLKAKCPGINVTSVELNPNVVTVAEDFFAFTGDVIVEDMHAALKELANEGRHFDAVINEVGHRVVLGEEGMNNTASLLNPNGIVLEKLSESDLGPEQLKVFKAYLGDVSEIKLGGSIILSGHKVGNPADVKDF